MTKTVAEHVPAYQPAVGITSARLEMRRAQQWIARVGSRTEAGWQVPVPFTFHIDYTTDTFTYNVG